MEKMEDKINSILNNPQLMQQIMTMAQNIGQSHALNQEESKQPVTQSGIDMAMIQKLSSIIQQSGIDDNQHALLSALSPYLSQDRVSRLERAMRAAKMAKYATVFLGK